LTCSALHRQGIKEVWDSMLSFQKQQKNSGAWELRRSDQAVEWLWQNLREELLHRLQRDKNIKGKIELLEKEVRDLKLLPRLACKQILAGTSLLYSEKPSLKRASPSK
jgi:LAO/AO transport system kinase